MRRRLTIGAGLVLSLAGAAVWSVRTPYQGFQYPVFLSLERGTGTREIANALAGAGVIRWAWEFDLIRVLHNSAKLQAGEYRFAKPASVREVFDRLARGDVYYVELTVPEGSNMFDIAALLDAVLLDGALLDGPGVLSGSEFLKAASDPAQVHDLDPAAGSLEGYLYPATYRLPHSITGEGLCRMMTARFRQEWQKLAGPATLAPHAIVTLASLVEKETGLPQERPLIAGVFANRLQKNMRLDCDPTTIYAALLDHRYSGAIHRSDLDSKNPYNTYQSDGLPPGPISNPGRESLKAAMGPAQTQFLYFVAKPEGGGHQFSATLAEHEKAVRDYRHANQTGTAKAAGKAG